MSVKAISSTQAQNNFGQVLNDIASNRTRYIVERHNSPIVVMLGFDDFFEILSNPHENEQMLQVIGKLRPNDNLGRIILSDSD